MFVRFAVTYKDKDSQQPQGLFHAARTLIDSGKMAVPEADTIQAIFSWFNGNLTVPKRRQLHERAIFWFKNDAQEHISRLWQLAHLLEPHGLLVEFVKTDRPGYVVYEDDHQVAAIPFRDTF